MRCVECGRRLTDEEVLHYEDRCDACEWVWVESVAAWRRGADDPVLDALYAAPPPSPLRH